MHRLCFLFLFATVPALAQDRALDISDLAAPSFTVYTPQDGLSDEIWSTVGFDARGFVWAGSASALSRFDGYRWSPQPFPQAHSLVRDMQLDADGRLWALFESEGLARYDGRAWTLHPTGPGALHRFSDLTGADGRLDLFVGHEHGFLRLVDGEWQPDPGDASVASGMPAAIERTQTLYGGPREWMGSLNHGLWYRTAGSATWLRFSAPGLPDLPITDLVRTVEHGHEELWLTSYGAGLARLRDDGVRVWRAATGELPGEAMYNARATISPSGDRLLWIATRAGLLRVRGDTVTVYDRRHGLPSDAVRGIKLQRTPEGSDVLWLATEGGIARAALAPSQWRTVSLHGARENGTFGLLLEPDGSGGERLWVGSMQQGLALLERGQWTYFTQAAGTLPAAGVRSLWRVPGPDGTDWRIIGLLGGKVLRVDDARRFTPLDVPWAQMPEEAVVNVLAREHDGARELWFATQRSGIHRLRNGEWTRYDGGSATSWIVWGLTAQRDAAGRDWLWAAGERGLARFDGTQWTFVAADGMPADSFRQATLIERNGHTELWASSYRHGVVRLDVTDPAAPRALVDDSVPIAPDPTVYSVLPDSRGRIYVCTNNGVQQLTPRAGGGFDVRVFRRRDGLVHDECNTNSQLVDAHDRYWVGTLGGLSVFDSSLRMPRVQTTPKPLHFIAARVDGETRLLDGVERLDLPAGTRELRIDYALLAGLRETESTYRSELAGFDPGPGDWSPERSRAFTGLPPGDYVLRLQARDYAGTESKPRELHIALRPWWWQRGDVRVALALLALLAAASTVMLYNRNLRQRQRHLRRVVDARTRELHVANQRLTDLSYQDALTGLANRRRLMESLAGAIERAVGQQRPIGLIVIDVDHFKRYNDRHGHLAGDAALRAVAQALQDATRDQDLVARFGGEEFACLMLDAGRDTVARVAERMRALVEALPPRTLGNDDDTLTISAGLLVRVPLPGESAADLLQHADAAMYRAKHDGRNCVREA